MNRNEGNLKHTRWQCKYHVVFIPKYRKKNIYGGVRTELGPILRELAKQTDDRVWSKVAHQTRTSSISKLKVSGGKRRGRNREGWVQPSSGGSHPSPRSSWESALRSGGRVVFKKKWSPGNIRSEKATLV